MSLLRCSLGLRLHDVDAALEIGPIFDHDPSGLDVAYQFGILADVNFVGCFDVVE